MSRADLDTSTLCMLEDMPVETLRQSIEKWQARRHSITQQIQSMDRERRIIDRELAHLQYVLWKREANG